MEEPQQQSVRPIKSFLLPHSLLLPPGITMEIINWLHQARPALSRSELNQTVRHKNTGDVPKSAFSAMSSTTYSGKVPRKLQCRGQGARDTGCYN